MRSWAALGVFACLLVPASADADPPADGTLRVVISGLESSDGRVGCALFTSARGFPDEIEHASRKVEVRIQRRRAACVFTDLAPGTYAVAVAHDENANGELDTGLFGIPTEGYGASNDAPASFGPPSWDDARLQLDGRGTAIRIRMRY